MAIATTTSTPSSDRVPRGTAKVQINFFGPPADGAKPFNYTDTPPEGQPQRNFTSESHEVEVEDIRGQEDKFRDPSASLDTHAFAIIRDVAPSAEREFVDSASIESKYYPEVKELLLRNIPGAERVVIFDHTVRRANDPASKRGPVLQAHIDQTQKSAIMRVRRHLPADDAEKLLQGRYRIINVWRPLNKSPVESFPLAFASSASVPPGDVVPVEHRYPEKIGYVGETAGIKYNPVQKWYYLSGMTGSERILLECYDSEAAKPGSSVAGGRVPHTAINDPRALPDAEGRESIEVRTLVFGP